MNEDDKYNKLFNLLRPGKKSCLKAELQRDIKRITKKEISYNISKILREQFISGNSRKTLEEIAKSQDMSVEDVKKISFEALDYIYRNVIPKDNSLV